MGTVQALDYSTLLFLHVLSAFAIVAGVAMQVAVGLALRRPAYAAIALRFAPAARVLTAVGGLLVLLFGIWLALHVGQYSLTDGWILAAIVLWAIAAGLGGRISAGYDRLARGGWGGAEAPALLSNAILVLVVSALLIDMIYKPGAS